MPITSQVSEKEARRGSTVFAQFGQEETESSKNWGLKLYRGEEKRGD